MKSEILITSGELARLMGVHPATIHRKVKLGEIPGRVNLGGRTFRFRADVIERWLKGGTKSEETDSAEAL